MENKSSYPYAQIDDNNIVTSVSMLWNIIKPEHPGYSVLIPISEYDPTIMGKRYTGRDADGYGLFEAVPEPEQTEPEQTEQEQTEPVA